MSKTPTQVLFLWHMHQPYYKRANDSLYYLPWTRLHGIKDYFGFVYFLSKFEKIKATFNFSPTGLEQIVDYSTRKASDRFLELTKKNPKDLTSNEKTFILKRFFSVNKERFINPYPRYLELFEKARKQKIKYFTDQEIRDIQLYFNLVWFHFTTIEEDKNLQELIKKSHGFSESDKKYVIDKQYDVLSMIIPLYKDLVASKRIEICISPYYHPILPLLCDTNIVHVHNQTAPRIRFHHPEEAFWHLKEGKDRTQQILNTKITGSWPSEGSVSPQVLKLYEELEFKWIATDEEILFNTLRLTRKNLTKNIPRDIIYQPYYFDDLIVFFRDKNLSNAISFTYHYWQDLNAAAQDLINHFHNIHKHTRSIYKKRMVLIAMDGENAWEYYHNNAKDFFTSLYSSLEKHSHLKTQTISSFIRNSDFKTIEEPIWPGSWINANFGVWSGSRENNRNWEILARIKNALDKKRNMLAPRKLEQAISYLRIIEGSDWNWWNTFDDISGDFGKLFLSYVKALSRILNQDFIHYKHTINI